MLGASTISLREVQLRIAHTLLSDDTNRQRLFDCQIDTVRGSHLTSVWTELGAGVQLAALGIGPSYLWSLVEFAVSLLFVHTDHGDIIWFQRTTDRYSIRVLPRPTSDCAGGGPAAFGTQMIDPAP